MNQTLNLFTNTRRVVAAFTSMIAGIFTDTVTQAAPVLAPLPPAFAVYTAMATKTPQWVAVATACAIELIGMFSSKETVRAWTWNKTRIKSEPAAPFPLALAMSAVYFIVVLALSIGIEIYPHSLIIIYPGFVLIAASTYVTSAIAHDLDAWQRERDERHAAQGERRKLSAEIKAQKARLDKLRAAQHDAQRATERARIERERIDAQNERARDAQVSAHDPQDAPRMSIDERRERVREMVSAGAERAEIMNELGVSRHVVARDIKALNGSLK